MQHDQAGLPLFLRLFLFFSHRFKLIGYIYYITQKQVYYENIRINYTKSFTRIEYLIVYSSYNRSRLRRTSGCIRQCTQHSKFRILIGQSYEEWNSKRSVLSIIRMEGCESTRVPIVFWRG